jgi:hypothetical protein
MPIIWISHIDATFLAYITIPLLKRTKTNFINFTNISRKKEKSAVLNMTQKVLCNLQLILFWHSNVKDFLRQEFLRRSE